jgi:hypothetical protein
MKSIFTGLVVLMSFSNAFAAKPTDGLPDAVAKYHLAIAGEDCDPELEQGSSTFELGQGRQLHIVPCMMGAYQGSSKAYISTNGLYPTQVIVLDKGDALVGSVDLMEADFDSKTGILSTWGKGRGLGDCGNASKTKIALDKYGSVSVKTIEIRSKQKCDGKLTDWPVVFKQK